MENWKMAFGLDKWNWFLPIAVSRFPFDAHNFPTKDEPLPFDSSFSKKFDFAIDYSGSNSIDLHEVKYNGQYCELNMNRTGGSNNSDES
jgi:hypothetical protein